MWPIRTMQPMTLILCSVLIALSIGVQGYITRAGDASAFLRLAPNDVRGWYGVERSDTIPTAQGVSSARYRWSYDQAQLNIWPVPAGMRIFSLTYLNTFGNVDFWHNQQRMAQLTPDAHLRTSHLLLPSEPAFQITFVQTLPQRIDQRILGFLVVSMEWRAWNEVDMVATPEQWLFVWGGLPLTTLLFIAFGWFFTTNTRYRTFLACIPLCGTLVVGFWSPWHSSAMQPLWQFVALAGLSGLAVQSVIQRIQRVGDHGWLVIIWVLSTVLLFTADAQGDGVGYYAYIRSLFIDGDLQFANEFNETLSPFAFVPSYPVYAPTGYTVNPWSIGPALLQVPFWLIAQSSTWLTNTVGLTNWNIDGYSAPFVNMVSLSSAVAGLVTLFGMYHLLCRQYTPRVAVFSTAFMYMASNLLYYAQINNNNVHSISTATVTIMLVACMATLDQPSRLRWAVFGASVGLIGIVYWVTLILCIFPAGVILSQTWSLWQKKDYPALYRLWWGVGIAATTAILVLALQSGVWYIMYDSLFTVPQGNAFALPQYPRLWQVFFGEWYGLLWWTPALFIGIFGLFAHARSHPQYGWWMVLAVWGYILYNASIPNWDGSSGFGFRRLASVAPFVAFGVAYVVTHTATARQLHVVIFAILSAWTTRFLLRYVEFRISRLSRTFLDDLVVATFDHAIINTKTLTTVWRPTWLGILWRTGISEQLIVSLLVMLLIGLFCFLWYHPIAPQWWGIAGQSRQTLGDSHDSHHTT
jgi:hypothetical protein